MKEIIMTSEGLKKLQDELEHLKTVERKEVAEKIKVALSFGDLSENSEYEEAKNDQALLESRISSIEAQLKNVRVLDESEMNSENVHVGSTVRIANEQDGKLVWQCPHCGNTDQTKMNVARRTCGYIGTQFWNQGRTQEIKERVLHL